MIYLVLALPPLLCTKESSPSLTKEIFLQTNFRFVRALLACCAVRALTNPVLRAVRAPKGQQRGKKGQVGARLAPKVQTAFGARRAPKVQGARKAKRSLWYKKDGKALDLLENKTA